MSLQIEHLRVLQVIEEGEVASQDNDLEILLGSLLNDLEHFSDDEMCRNVRTDRPR